jgi:hypothetical protein
VLRVKCEPAPASLPSAAKPEKRAPRRTAGQGSRTPRRQADAAVRADACAHAASLILNFLRPPGRSVGRAVQPVSRVGARGLRRASKILAEPVARDPVVPMVPLCFRPCSRSHRHTAALC